MTVNIEKSNSTSSSLLGRAKDNDPEAWQRLCELYAPLVYRWARQWGVRGEHVADVGQEVFQVVAARLQSFRHDQPGDSFRGWLCGITRNKVREHFRRQTITFDGEGGSEALERLKQLTGSVSNNSLPPDVPNERSLVLRQTLEQIRGEMERTTWQAFWRSTVGEEKAKDIADDLNISPAAVRQAKYRVLRRLRAELADIL